MLNNIVKIAATLALLALTALAITATIYMSLGIQLTNI